MAHEITIRENGKAEFAFTGSRSQIWHQLGSELTVDASIDQWKKEAGLDWELFESMVQYQSMDGMHFFDDKRVLFRSDTKKPLSVVSSTYNIVQPGDILEFFRDLTGLHGFKLSAAGSLFGGKRFWATAEVGKTFSPLPGDETKGYLLLVSSCDFSMSTQARYCNTRSICSNTMTIALNESSKNVVKKTHASEWDATQTKLDLGILDTAWEKFSANIKKLAEIEITDDYAKSFLVSKFYNKNLSADEQTTQTYNKVTKVMDLYKNGAGANLSGNTAWGLLNSFTNMSTHGLREKHEPSRRFWEGTFGAGDKLNTEVFNDLLALAA